MATLREIREALAEAIGAVDGLNVSPYQLSSPLLPAAYVLPRKNARQAMGPVASAITEHVFRVRVLVAGGLDQGAQIRLDEFIDAGALPTALEADRTLGGVVQSLVVEEMTDYDPVVIGENTEAWRVEWSVRVYP